MLPRVPCCYIFLTLLTLPFIANSYHGEMTGNEIKLVEEYFVTKKVSRVTGFVCWGKREISFFVKEFSNSGIQSNFIEAQYDKDNFHRALSRLGEVRERWPLGMLIDATCPFFEMLLDLAFQYKIFDSMHFWLILHERLALNDGNERKEYKIGCPLDPFILKEINKTFSNAQMLVDSEVTFVTKRVRVNDSLTVTPIYTDKNYAIMDMPPCAPRATLSQQVEAVDGAISTQIKDSKCFILNLPRDFHPTSLRRSDFQGAKLMAGTVITKPKLFTGMHDLKMRHVDTWTKIDYILVEQMEQDLNFNLTVKQFDNWGYQTNGSFDGLVGAIQRKEIDLGATGMMFKEDRLLAMDYVGETYKFRASILFRQPSLASITNIFLQPFSSTVWMYTLLTFVIMVVVLSIEMKVEGKYQQKVRGEKRKCSKKKKDAAHYGEILMMVVGAACQQGFYSPPSSLSARTTFLTLWMASLFLFTSYAANVVALLQTPSHMIRSLTDLLKAPMKVGIQDAIYNHAYFKETTDALSKELYKEKIEPYHERAYYNEDEGMKMVQQGLFAFQVEHTIGFKIISETFTEEEKCGLGNVELLRTPTLGMPIARNSPYKEILSQKLHLLREIGVLDRTSKQWIPQKPSCTHSHHPGSPQFVSIRLEELRSPFFLLCAGAIFSVLLLILECLIYKYIIYRRRPFSYRD